MKLAIQPSRGVIPRLAAQLLPDQNAQIAINAKLLSGDLESWRDPEFVSNLYKSGTVNTIHLMDRQHWLHWVDSELGSGAVEVDVARGPIAGDTTERTYFAGTDAPRQTNLAKAIGSCGMQYPCDSLLLGVPAPTVAPVLTIDATDPDVSNVTLTNPGAETGGTTGWILDEGDLGVHNATDVPGLAPKEGNYFFHGGAAASLTRAHQTLVLSSIGVFPQQNLSLKWWQASGANGSKATMGLRFYNASSVLIGEVLLDREAVSPALSWVQRSVSGVIPSNAETVRLVMEYERVGGGANDAFIDAITAETEDYEEVFGCEDFDGWTKGPETGSTKVEIDASAGLPAPSWRFTQNNSVSYLFKDIGLATSPKAHIEADMYSLENLTLMLYASQEGYGVGVNVGENGCRVVRTNSWSDQGTTTLAQLASSVEGRWVHVVVDVNTISAVSANLKLTITALDNGSVLVDAHEMSIEVSGSFIGFKSRSNESSERSWVDNVKLSVVAPEPDNPTEIVFTNYVWTYCNEFNEEGPPSPVSRTVQRSNNAPIEVETPTSAPAGYGITHKCLYRSATGSSGTAYLLVEKVLLADDSYTDTKADFDLGRALETQLADLPPTDLRGLLALPNSFLAGFSKNEICFSEQGRYHSWPVDYRLTTDHSIVAIGAIDASLVVLTESFPYIVTGYSPDAMSMRKLEVPYACSSKRSVANLKDFGIAYASSDGLVAINAQGAPVLLSDGLLTREQWQELKPESICGIAHDDRYFGFYDKGDGDRGGFILDARQGGFGLVFIQDWAQAAYSDPLTDKLYLVMGNDVWAWDEGSYRMPYVWRSKLFRMPRPTAFAAAQVLAKDYNDLTLKLFADGELAFTKPILSMQEFVLPDDLCQYSVEVELSGTSRVELVELAEVMEELG